jgi:hypothetical protein
MENWSDFDFLCRKVLECAENGDPIQDALEQTSYSETEFILELVRHYLQRTGLTPAIRN